MIPNLSAVKITGAASLPFDSFQPNRPVDRPVLMDPVPLSRPINTVSNDSDDSEFEEFLFDAFINFDPKASDSLSQVWV